MGLEKPTPPIYHETGPDKGRVIDTGVAHEMAKVENPYHEKVAGVWPPTKEGMKRRIARGEQAAEAHIARGQEIRREELPAAVLQILVRHEVDPPSARTLSPFDDSRFHSSTYRRADYGQGKAAYTIGGWLENKSIFRRSSEKPPSRPRNAEMYELRIQMQGDEITGKEFGRVSAGPTGEEFHRADEQPTRVAWDVLDDFDRKPKDRRSGREK